MEINEVNLLIMVGYAVVLIDCLVNFFYYVKWNLIQLNRIICFGNLKEIIVKISWKLDNF